MHAMKHDLGNSVVTGDTQVVQASDSLLAANSNKRVRETPRLLKACIVKGKSDTCTQSEPLCAAMGEFAHRVQYTILSHEHFHKEGSDWLLEDAVHAIQFNCIIEPFDFHIIATHLNLVNSSFQILLDIVLYHN